MNNSLRRYGIWVVIALVGARLLGYAGPRARGDDQRRVDALRGAGLLRHRLQVLRALHPGQGAGSRRLAGDAAESGSTTVGTSSRWTGGCSSGTTSRR